MVTQAGAGSRKVRCGAVCVPHEGVWAFPGDSENLPTASKGKSELVRLVRPQYRRVRVHAGGDELDGEKPQTVQDELPMSVIQETNDPYLTFVRGRIPQ